MFISQLFSKCRRVALGACLALTGTSVYAAEDYTQWAHSTDIFLNTTPDGAHVNANVTGFPMLVRLTAANFSFAQAQGKGQDIRFSKPAGAGPIVPIAYEIERWDSTAGLAEIWVKMDTVLGNSKDQSLRMYWGKTAVKDSSSGNAVFDTAAGFVAAWHLGGAGTAARKNSSPGGNSAATHNFDGDETRTGVVGLADSLDGADSLGDYFDIGDGYTKFTSGFTYVVWINPASAANYAKLLDLGNGAGKESVSIYRVATSNDLGMRVWNGADTSKRVIAPGVLALNQWQQYGFTVAGKVVKFYRNGDLILTDTISVTISGLSRATNYIGRSAWANNAYYKGKIDEPVLHKTARNADWMRLCYANQRPDQVLYTFIKPVTCQAKFDGPADTTLSEGLRLMLDGTADCASSFSWSVVSGPAPRILDPEVKSLQVVLPRITQDTSIVYRFSATIAGVVNTKDVKVTVKNLIPDPIFTLPAAQDWNGVDSIFITPVISNLKAVKASPDSTLFYTWTFSGPETDTAWGDAGLMLKAPRSSGVLQINLCLDNGGTPSCKTTTVNITLTSTSIGRRAAMAALRPLEKRRSVTGRLLPWESRVPGYLHGVTEERRAR